jgi:hypothetical protein
VPIQASQRLAQHIGDNLHPQFACRTAIRDDVAFYRIADVNQRLDMVFDGVGVGFEQRAPDMPRVVAERQAKQDATGIWIM